MKRMQYAIRYEQGRWVFKLGKTVIVEDPVKLHLVRLASAELVRAQGWLALRSELTIHRRDGTIQDRRTYGQDPRRSPG